MLSLQYLMTQSLIHLRQDAGGPTREFFCLLWVKIAQDGSLSAGSEDTRLVQHNILALQKHEFEHVGHPIALSLMYGGNAPHFFSEAVTKYILVEPLDINAVKEVPDYMVQMSLQKGDHLLN